MLITIGTGNINECMSLINRLLNMSSCNSPQCSINGYYQPPIDVILFFHHFKE